MVLVVALGAWRLTVAAGHSSARAALWETVAGGVQANVAVGHVWLEEYIAGDHTISVSRDILGNFDAARARCRALANGGRSPEGPRVTAVDDPQLRAEVLRLSRRLDVLRALSVQRIVRRTPAGSSADQNYDAHFRAALALAERLPVRIRALANDDENRLKVIETAAIVVLGVTLLLAVAIIRGAQRQVERLAHERETVLESAAEGILAIDPGGRIRFANATAGVLLAWPSRELAGQRVDALIPAGGRAAWGDALASGTGSGTAELLRRDGTRFPIEYTATPADADGARTAIVVTFRDATARHRRERERDEELAELRAMRATLVPADLPARPDLRFATCFVPSMGSVAGDFYLVAAGPGDTTIVVVGDVSGKGLAAAQCAAFVRTSLATFARYTSSPSRLLELANSALLERGHDYELLATAACAVVDPAAQTITWSLAGHPAPFRLDSGRGVTVKPGLPLGLEQETGAEEAVVPLREGVGFVLFTDALYETRSGGQAAEPEHFGFTRIGELVAGLGGAEPAEVVRALREAAERFSDGTLTDDLCILAFRLQPARAPGTGRRVPRPGGRGDRRARTPPAGDVQDPAPSG
jgi:PAS domain S-box-containing protein